jgi:hypothetical protein
VIDLDAYLIAVRDKADGKELTPAALAECQKVIECFHNYGILVIRDPRVNFQENETYIDLMEKYFERSGELFYTGEKVEDIHPEYHYQVGATPEFIEKARDHAHLLKELNLESKDTPVSPLEPIADAKWRYMWKVGERPEGAADDFP